MMNHVKITQWLVVLIGLTFRRLTQGSKVFFICYQHYVSHRRNFFHRLLNETDQKKISNKHVIRSRITVCAKSAQILQIRDGNIWTLFQNSLRNAVRTSSFSTICAHVIKLQRVHETFCGNGLVWQRYGRVWVRWHAMHNSETDKRFITVIVWRIVRLSG